MLSFEKEYVVSFIGTGDQEDGSRMLEIEVESGAAQGGSVENFSRKVQVQVLISLRWRIITP